MQKAVNDVIDIFTGEDMEIMSLDIWEIELGHVACDCRVIMAREILVKHEAIANYDIALVIV